MLHRWQKAVFVLPPMYLAKCSHLASDSFDKLVARIKIDSDANCSMAWTIDQIPERQPLSMCSSECSAL